MTRRQDMMSSNPSDYVRTACLKTELAPLICSTLSGSRRLTISVRRDLRSHPHVRPRVAGGLRSNGRCARLRPSDADVDEGAVEDHVVPGSHLADAHVPRGAGGLEVELRELAGLRAQERGGVRVVGLHALQGDAAPPHQQLQPEGRADGHRRRVEGVLHSGGGQFEGEGTAQHLHQVGRAPRLHAAPRAHQLHRLEGQREVLRGLGNLGGLGAPQQAPLPLQLRRLRGVWGGVERREVLNRPLHL
mmetsp:Transcript_7150/g.14500  ORF Transcript_7150/g.14500 Transcript_7150/m.14500 type:complete len:246 (-) Transcript_7150:499-1236(-)